MVYNDYTKQRIVYYLHQRHHLQTIADLINDKEISMSELYERERGFTSFVPVMTSFS